MGVLWKARSGSVGRKRLAEALGASGRTGESRWRLVSFWMQQVTGTRENELELCQRRFRVAIRRSFFTGSILKHWNRLLRELVESPSLDVLKSHPDVVLKDMV